MLVGICGTICSGKSTILKQLENEYKIICVDKEVAKLHIELKQEIFEIFQTNDKAKIMEIILQNPSQEEKLKQLLMSEIIKKIHAYDDDEQIVLVEAANVFALGLHKHLNQCIYFNASEAFCLRNSQTRKTHPREIVMQLIKKQIKENKYLINANHILNIGENLDENVKNLKLLLNKLGK